MSASARDAPAHCGWTAGVGCRAHCPVEALRTLLDGALARAGIERNHLAALATIAAKQEEPELQELAAELGLTLQAWRAGALHPYEDRLSVRSEYAFAALGCYGVAESAALAAAEWNGHASTLAVPRLSNGHATVAIARYPRGC